jgi:hypothetical protein
MLKQNLDWEAKFQLFPIVIDKPFYRGYYSNFKDELEITTGGFKLIDAVFLRTSSFVEDLRSVTLNTSGSFRVLLIAGKESVEILREASKNNVLRHVLWYLPDAYFWGNHLKNDPVAWKMARRVSLRSSIVIPTNFSDFHSRTISMKLNQILNSSHASRTVYDAFLAAAALDSVWDKNTSSIFERENVLFAQISLIPEIPKSSAIEFVHDSPWIVDPVIKRDNYLDSNSGLNSFRGYHIKKSDLQELTSK